MENTKDSQDRNGGNVHQPQAISDFRNTGVENFLMSREEFCIIHGMDSDETNMYDEYVQEMQHIYYPYHQA